jgi:hypothetical protein
VEFEFFLCSGGSGIQHVHEDETLNREVCDALLALQHVAELPLGDVTFESLVSVLPLDYSRAISVAHDGMWGHGVSGDSHETHGDTSAHTAGAQVATVLDDTDTGTGNTEMDLQFSQQVRHRERTRTPTVQETVTKLMSLRVDKDTGTGRGRAHSGVTPERIKTATREFGESSGCVFHQTKHMQKGGQSILRVFHRL